MTIRLAALGIMTAASILSATQAAPPGHPIPPGKQHRLTIEGENTVTFLPQANVPAFTIDYQAKVEYIVDSRYGKPSKPPTVADAKDDDDTPPAEQPSPKGNVSSKKPKARKAESPASKASGAVDLSIHSSRMTIRQDGQTLVETRIDRGRYQGRMQPEAPVIGVTAAEAPPRLQEIMKNYDIVVASLSLNDDDKVINRRVRNDGPQRAIIETLLSIHSPIPKGVDSWESPSQLAMGQGHVARGNLRFEREKAKTPGPIVDAKAPVDPSSSPAPVKVKVSGVLKAEGVVAGRFIKDGTYTVTGEQTFDPKTHDWTSTRWSVAVANELANQAGQTVAHAKGTMTVSSEAVDTPTTSPGDSTAPKL